MLWYNSTVSISKEAELLKRPQRDGAELCMTLFEMSKNLFTNAYLWVTSSRDPSDLDGFISMDLVGPFKMTTMGNQCALTVICMLTIYVIFIPLTDKCADTVVNCLLKKGVMQTRRK